MSSVLLMNNGYPTAKNPSYAAYIKSMKEGLDAAGHDVSLLVLNADFSNKREQAIQYAKYYKQIWKTDIKEYDYVLLNHYGHFALPLQSKLLSIKRPIVHWHGEDLYPKNKLVDKLFTHAAKALPLHTRHIAPSLYYKQQIAKKLEIAGVQIAVSPSGGVDTDLFSPAADRIIPGDSISLGFASGLEEEKGIKFVIQLLKNADVIEKLTGCKIMFHYIYYGRQKAHYHALLQQFPNVVCHDAMPSALMPQFYNAIDVLLFPTFRKQESLGLVALEAMSTGKPVLGPDAFAAREYIRPGITGELFEPGNEDELFDKLVLLIKNVDQYDTRPMVLDKYSRQSVVQFYKEYFA